MKEFGILILFLLFIIHNNDIIYGSLYALNIWSNKLFPILFPTFIICDLILSTNLINIITKKFGNIFSKIFNTSPYGLYIFLISLLTGTPSNAKNIKYLYDNNLIDCTDISRLLTMTYFFNPFFILKYTNIKILLIFWISNIITALLFRNYFSMKSYKIISVKYNYNFNDSISNNLNILFNILGVLSIIMAFIYALPINNIYLKVLLSGLLEITTGLEFNKLYINSSYFILLFLNLGGLSILLQIKSILKDTLLDYKYLLFYKLVCITIGFILLT